jgi:hypothetical protein
MLIHPPTAATADQRDVIYSPKMVRTLGYDLCAPGELGHDLVPICL